MAAVAPATALTYWSEIDLDAKDEWSKALGKQLSELRDEKGLTQAQMAEQLDVGRRTIVKYETGNGGRLDFYIDYCEALGVDLALLALRARAALKVSAITTSDLDELGDELLGGAND